MTLGTTLFIVNPTACHGETAKLIPAIEELVDGVFPATIVATEGPEHAIELARTAEGIDTIVAVGGDGTVHEVMNGVMRRDAANRPAVSLLPTGSGNDYRRTLGIPTGLAAAFMAIAAGRPQAMDVGVCNGVYFANSVAMGLDARVTAQAVEMKITTGRSGIPLYLSALFAVLRKGIHGYNVRVTIDGSNVIEQNMLMLAITNGPTYGGGFHITPEASGTDGVFDTCLVDDMGLVKTLMRVPLVIPGWHTGVKEVHMGHATSLVLESLDGPVPGQIDGEVLLTDRYEIEMLPTALTWIVPTETGR